MTERLSETLTGNLLVIAAASLAGSGAILAKLAYARGFQPLPLLAVRFIASSLFLLPFSIGRWEREFRLSGRTLVKLILVAAANLAASIFFFSALTFADASVLVPIFYTYPALILVMSRLRGEGLDYRHLIALLLGWFGVWLVSGGDLSANHRAILYGLSAALCFAVYVVLAQSALSGIGSQAGVTYVTLFLACGSSILWPLSRQNVSREVEGWVAVFALALIATVAARLAFFAGLKRIGSNQAALLGMSEPLAVLLMAAVVLSERFFPIQWIGAGMILASSAWSLRFLRKVSPIHDL